MSRVAKTPVKLPNGVEINVEREKITVKGPKGSLSQNYNRLVAIEQVDDGGKELRFKPASNDPNAWAQAGTARAIISNMVHGVTQGFEKTLELVGVGYRAQVKGQVVVLALGYSHPVEHTLAPGVTAEASSPTVLILRSLDKQLLGQAAADIRAYRPPEPYKGKGVRYAGEIIVTKETKKK